MMQTAELLLFILSVVLYVHQSVLLAWHVDPKFSFRMHVCYSAACLQLVVGPRGDIIRTQHTVSFQGD